MYNSDNKKTENPFEDNSCFRGFISFLKTCIRNFSASAWVRSVINYLLDLSGKIVAKFSFWADLKKINGILYSCSFELAKDELLSYYRLEQYICYSGIDEAKNYIQKITDDYKTVLQNKKNEVITINGKELTYADYISQLPEDQLEILVQILPKKGSESLTYGDLQKLAQTIEAQKKQGGIAVLLNCENLLRTYADDIEDINRVQKFINQKHEEMELLDKITCLEDIKTKKEQLEKELSHSSANEAGKKYLENKIISLNNKKIHIKNPSEQIKLDKDIKKFETDLQILKNRDNAISEIISCYKNETIYTPVKKELYKYNNTDKNDGKIVTPVSATEYKVVTENDGIIYAVYGGKDQYLAKIYYRSASGHFYNQNGQEEKPTFLYNSDRTLRAEISYDSKENGYKILKETDFAKEDSKKVTGVTHYKYDINGVFIWTYTEVFGMLDMTEMLYRNQDGNLCKCVKEYSTGGNTYRDVYGYSGGKINDKPSITYILVNNKWQKS